MTLLLRYGISGEKQWCLQFSDLSGIFVITEPLIDRPHIDTGVL